MGSFVGAPSFNTIDYFVILLVFSLVAVPLSYLSAAKLFQRFLHIGLGSLCLFSVAPRLLVFYLVFWIIVYLFTIAARLRVRGVLAYAKIVLPVLAILTPLMSWKLDPLAFERFLNLEIHELIWSIWRPLGEIDAVYLLVAPLGLSFSVFRAIDLIAEVHIGVVERPGPFDVLAYGLFAPVQIVGPIIQYRAIERPVPGGAARRDLTRWGLLQIVMGLAKAFVIGWPILWSSNIATVFADQPVWAIWLSILVFPVYLYLNFSGFSDISIGAAAVYGYRMEPNFNRPLLRSSLQQFWNNWHMSLTRFAQRNIFVPLGGYRRQTQYVALFCTMMVIALWHDLSIALAVFGALHGLALIAGRMVAARRSSSDRPVVAGMSRGPSGPYLGWLRTYAFIVLTFPLLIVEDGDILGFYFSLVGIGRGS